MSRWRAEPLRLALPACDDPVGALARALDDAPIARGTRVACAVPTRFARPLVIPWNPQMQRPAERALFAQACFREVFGELASAWAIRVDAPRYGQPALACAMPAALLDALLALVRERGLKLVSVQPALVQAANACRAAAEGAPYWLALAEPPALSLMLVETGSVQRVKVLAAAATQAQALATREWFGLGREEALPRVIVVDAGEAVAP